MSGILLIDLSQVLIASLMVQVNNKSRIAYDQGNPNELSEELIRHIVLNSLRNAVTRFRNDYPTVVICCDNKRTWRRDYFPHYKANRKKNRDNSLLNWSVVFQILGKIKEELKEYLPYKVIEVEGAEADDIIGYITLHRPFTTPIMIYSGDQDYQQLQKVPNVRQYSLNTKTFISCENPHLYLKEHIICGDRGDGIPNILSQDDSFVIGKRQNRLNRKKIEIWLNQEPSDFCTTHTMRAYHARNKVLIDLEQTPADIKEKIGAAVSTLTVEGHTKQKLMSYFISKKLVNLLSDLSDF